MQTIQKMRAEEGDNYRPINAADVDNFAWVYRRKHALEVEKAVRQLLFLEFLCTR